MFTSTTCLLPDNPLNDVIGNIIDFFSIFKNTYSVTDTNAYFLVNTSDEPLVKKTKRSSDIIHVIAPGQRHKTVMLVDRRKSRYQCLSRSISKWKRRTEWSHKEKEDFLCSKLQSKNVESWSKICTRWRFSFCCTTVSWETVIPKPN